VKRRDECRISGRSAEALSRSSPPSCSTGRSPAIGRISLPLRRAACACAFYAAGGGAIVRAPHSALHRGLRRQDGRIQTSMGVSDVVSREGPTRCGCGRLVFLYRYPADTSAASWRRSAPEQGHADRGGFRRGVLEATCGFLRQPAARHRQNIAFWFPKFGRAFPSEPAGPRPPCPAPGSGHQVICRPPRTRSRLPVVPHPTLMSARRETRKHPRATTRHSLEHAGLRGAEAASGVALPPDTVHGLKKARPRSPA